MSGIVVAHCTGRLRAGDRLEFDEAAWRDLGPVMGGDQLRTRPVGGRVQRITTVVRVEETLRWLTVTPLEPTDLQRYEVMRDTNADMPSLPSRPEATARFLGWRGLVLPFEMTLEAWAAIGSPGLGATIHIVDPRGHRGVSPRILGAVGAGRAMTTWSGRIATVRTATGTVELGVTAKGFSFDIPAGDEFVVSSLADCEPARFRAKVTCLKYGKPGSSVLLVAREELRDIDYHLETLVRRSMVVRSGNDDDGSVVVESISESSTMVTMVVRGLDAFCSSTWVTCELPRLNRAENGNSAP